MDYDIEADWQLLNTCNYRCAYCFFSPATLGEKLTVYAEPEVWRQAFNRTALTWLLHITGGEPTIYPRFAELCQLLTATHYLSFNSNLTHPSIVEFANRVDPSRINFINAGLHAKEREIKKGLTRFLEHVACLKERNFPIFISIVATPDVLSRVDDIVALTEPIGLAPIPKLMRGAYKGKIYPEAYSAKERSTFMEFATRARESYDPLLGALAERPSIDVFGDENYVHGTPWFRGRACSAGENFISLQPDGEIYRCEKKQSNYLGNILDGSFRRRVGKSPCDSNYCFYFCLKYADTPKPRPNSEAALRRSIDELREGKPNYDRMSPGLANATKQQLSELRAMIADSGTLKSVSFNGVGPAGADIYDVTFDKGAMRWRIIVGADGKSEAIGVQTLP